MVLYRAQKMELHGRSVLVTGGASGLGFGFAKALLAEGAKVSIVDFNEEAGRATEKDLAEKYGSSNVIFCPCNVTSQEQFADAFRRTREVLGGPDIVVNNAGVGGETDDKWESVIDINLKGTLRGTRLALKYMSKAGGGSGGVIVNMASMAGVNPNPFAPVYGASKAGIIHATRSLAISPDVQKSGIRLNVMCPAFVDTPMFRNMASGDASQTSSSDQMAVKAFVDHIGVMSVDEVAAAFLDLVKDETRSGIILRCAKKTGIQYSTLAVQDV
ncbi:15-hydroxyprostaglandin dehydrogenase [NAD(+)]-like isoform X1 [Mya arenaria]|uniref:15-hydroxyprostaglandin dehydrogenase [NAD(+)]-like isoform X1 n=1 Tax=Mya arenaria TaxID=6604 RepID=UPI0022E337A5|nr:15-hydroxyprostaglandin dehydrogenase [NAD(+)]-like isoform X1 [Mya arenaria]XP_052817509.1 15-hydroxyprostaglandin dehydrogenase [NAD(+)]-like isoform X1 [Mya arenaria]